MGRTRSPGQPAKRQGRRDPGEVARAVAELSALSTKALQQRWRALCGVGPPPGVGRALLLRVVAYRIQEDSFGGLRATTRRFLNECCEGPNARARPITRAPGAATAGTVLVREWQGTSHRVIVLDQGCTWRGQRYRSLSEVARAITGVHWSGPRFFGLGRAMEARRNGTREA